MNLINLIGAKMKWHQARHSVIAENVANAETPGYQAKDIVMPQFEKLITASQKPTHSVGMQTTHQQHIHALSSKTRTSNFKERLVEPWEITHSRNAVVLEQEMMRMSENQLGFEMASNIYKKSVNLYKAALGKSA